MKTFFAATLAAIALIATPQAGAQDSDAAARQALAREIVLATTTEDLYRASMDPILPLVRDSFAASMPGATSQQLDEVTEILIEIIMETYDEMIEETAGIYASRFTEDELRELLAFHQTEIGQKVNSELPAIMQEAALIGERLGTTAVTQNAHRLQAVFETNK